MRIEDYGFGRITIDGETYGKDVLVLPPRVISPWWRREGHRLEIDDLGEVVAYAPRILVVGTGAYGVMRVPDQTLSRLEAAGIEVEVLPSGEAVRRFNEWFEAQGTVAAAIHLTC